MARETETNLLKETLIYSMAINIKNDIIKLKQIFITPANKQYLACWFNFFEKDFFEKNLKTQEAQYQWMQDILNSFNKKIMTDEQKENKFISFKFKKEILFPWDEQIELELFEASLPLEEQRNQEEKSKISKKIEVLKIELYCKLSSKKLELKDKLFKNIEKQDNLLVLYNKSVQNLKILQQKKKSNFFKFKSNIINIFTFGCYNCDQKLTNNIVEKEEKINSWKTKFNKIQLKISDIKSGLDKIEKVISEKRKLLNLLDQQITNIKEINSINIQNTEVSTNNSLTTQL